MSFLLSAAEKDLRRHWRDPTALVLWAAIPLIIGSLIALAMSGFDRAPPAPHVLIADQDGGNLSWLFSRAFSQAETAKFVRVEEVTEEVGRARIGRGDGSALLIVPAGFGKAVFEDKPTTLHLVTNPAQRILPQMVEETLEMGVDGVFYLHRLAGPEMRQLARGPAPGQKFLPNEEIARLSVAFNKLALRLNKYLFPPVLEVEARVEATPGQKVSIVQLFLPGILFMALVFMAEGMSADFWRERQQGTLRRSACTPAALPALTGGKLLAQAVIMAVVAFVVLLAGMLYLGLPLTKLPIMLAWSVAAGMVFLLLLQLLQLYASSQRAASVLSNSIAMPLLFVGGSFFPLEMMPGWMAAVGRWTPNGWALDQLKDILYDRDGLGGLLAGFAALGAIGLVLLALTLRRLRSFARG